MFYSLPYPGKKSGEPESPFLIPGLTHKYMLSSLVPTGPPPPPAVPPYPPSQEAQLAEPFRMAS